MTLRCRMNKAKIATETGCDFLQLIHFSNTLFANMLVAVLNQGAVCTTENTGRFQLLQDNSVFIQTDLQFIPLSNIQCAAKLDRQHYSAQFVHSSHDSRCFHSLRSPLTIHTFNRLISFIIQYSLCSVNDFKQKFIPRRIDFPMGVQLW